jgi:hypothetical protein
MRINLTVSQTLVSGSERRSMGNARASWRERPPISVASLQSSSERGVQAATADPLGWLPSRKANCGNCVVARSPEGGIVSRSEIRNP